MPKRCRRAGLCLAMGWPENSRLKVVSVVGMRHTDDADDAAASAPFAYHSPPTDNFDESLMIIQVVKSSAAFRAPVL
jgi:hypothetical protein